jgi:hypothetical protein
MREEEGREGILIFRKFIKGGTTMKTQTIQFSKFMDNTWRKDVPKSTFSFMPIPTISSMFVNSPVLIIGGIGVLIVGLALYEKHLVKNGREYEAEVVSMITGIGLPMAAIGGGLYVVFHASKLFL